MRFIEYALLLFLMVTAVAAVTAKKTLTTVLLFMSYGLVMSVIWMLLQAPDLAITEAAVGAGINSVLLFITLKKAHDLRGTIEKDD
jgi:energy-converting hydrogenase B subunit D